MNNTVKFGLIGIGGLLLYDYFTGGSIILGRLGVMPDTAIPTGPGSAPQMPPTSTTTPTGSNPSPTSPTGTTTPTGGTTPVVAPINNTPPASQSNVEKYRSNESFQHNTNIAAAGGSQADIAILKEVGQTYNSDQWNWYRQQSGKTDTVDIFPADNRNKQFTIEEYFNARSATGLNGLMALAGIM
jgi:hypothetical protein